MEANALPPAATPDAQTNAISDARFAEQLRIVERLKQFVFDEKVSIGPDRLEAIDLGVLNNLKFGATGRLPTEDEWRTLDKLLSSLVSLLTPELRWKLRIKELKFFFETMPLMALGVAVLATFYYSLYPQLLPGIKESDALWNISYLAALIVWTISQGVLGACAFLGVTIVTARTAVPITTSEPLAVAVDITDRSIVIIRIILGAMFAFLIGLPLSYRAMYTITRNVFEIDPSKGLSSSDLLRDFLFLLAPFMFGFSTSLVLGIFNKIVRAINALLGISSEPH